MAWELLRKAPMDFPVTSASCLHRPLPWRRFCRITDGALSGSGKDHNVPETDLSAGANKSQWPLQQGYDRFYGFIGGETNQFYPDLTEDNHAIEQPYGPEQGYHLSKDLADQAIKMIADQNSANPSKPWFMWYCPGSQSCSPPGTRRLYCQV